MMRLCPLGILAGEKQSIKRGYDFAEILKWFAERADRIILLFDAHKLDISDEFKQAIMSIREHDDKIRWGQTGPSPLSVRRRLLAGFV